MDPRQHDDQGCLRKAIGGVNRFLMARLGMARRGKAWHGSGRGDDKNAHQFPNPNLNPNLTRNESVQLTSFGYRVHSRSSTPLHPIKIQFTDAKHLLNRYSSHDSTRGPIPENGSTDQQCTRRFRVVGQSRKASFSRQTRLPICREDHHRTTVLEMGLRSPGFLRVPGASASQGRDQPRPDARPASRADPDFV